MVSGMLSGVRVLGFRLLTLESWRQFGREIGIRPPIYEGLWIRQYDILLEPYIQDPRPGYVFPAQP